MHPEHGCIIKILYRLLTKFLNVQNIHRALCVLHITIIVTAKLCQQLLKHLRHAACKHMYITLLFCNIYTLILKKMWF